MKRILAGMILVAVLAIITIIWGCSGGGSRNSQAGNGSGNGIVSVSPSPPGSNTSGTTGTFTGSITGLSTSGTAATTTAGTTTATTSGTTTATTTAGTTTAATTTAGTTTATSNGTTTGATTIGTSGGNNTTQILVVNSTTGFEFAFTSPVTVSSGTSVVWVNQTGADHGITWETHTPSSSPPPGNNVPIFGPGTESQVWQVPVVTVQTTYNYQCTVHGANMTGQIIVMP